MPETLDIGTPRRVAIVMLSAIGDAVHVLPVANALRRAWPQASLTWIIQPVPHRLVEHHPAIDEFIVFQRRRGTAALRAYADLVRAFEGRRWDLLLNLQVYMKAGLITALAPADVKLGFDRRRARDLNWAFTTHRIPARRPGHVQDQYLEFVRYLGITPEPIEWRLGPTDAERDAQQAFFARLDRPACAIVVGTSKPAKNWAPERYARLVDVLESDFGLRAMLVGGPSPIERAAADRIARLAKHPPLDALANDIRRLVWLLAGSAVVVSPDTGPLHIARALDVPVVGLYGYTNPRRYGPYGRFQDLVVDGYAREPGEAYPLSTAYRPGGMDRVTVDAVAAAVGRALERYVRA
jgi:heptosyltransferase I